MINTTSNAFQKLKDRVRRRRFIANQIRNGFAFQVRALRKNRVMTQQELASAAETTQAVISRIEKNGADNLNIKTLKKIADAFDVALIVRLEPIDRLLGWVDDLSPDLMAPERSEKILADIERRGSVEHIRHASANTGSRVDFKLIRTSTEQRPIEQAPFKFMYSRPCEIARTETIRESVKSEFVSTRDVANPAA